jgi:hypothetical protein
MYKHWNTSRKPSSPTCLLQLTFINYLWHNILGTNVYKVNAHYDVIKGFFFSFCPDEGFYFKTERNVSQRHAELNSTQWKREFSPFQKSHIGRYWLWIHLKRNENNKISYTLFEFKTRTVEIIPDAVITTDKATEKKIYTARYYHWN